MRMAFKESTDPRAYKLVEHLHNWIFVSIKR